MQSRTQICKPNPDTPATFRLHDDTSGLTRILRTADDDQEILIQRLRHGRTIGDELVAGGLEGIPPGELLVEESRLSVVYSVGPQFLLLSELWAQQDLSLCDKLIILRSAVQTIRGIHQRGMIYNNFSMESILVNQLDFSQTFLFCLEYTCTDSSLQPIPSKPVACPSLLTAAPELSGRVPFCVDLRSDIYSFGVVLYELLTGMPLFHGTTALELVHQHITSIPVPISATSAPESINKLVDKCLQKNPIARYQCAESLLFDLTTLIQAISTDDFSKVEIGNIDALSTFRLDSVFLDRKQGKHQLEELAKAVISRGRNKIAVIKGYGGSGKSSLVQQAARCFPAMHIASSKYNFAKIPSTFGNFRFVVRDLTTRLLDMSLGEYPSLPAHLAVYLGEDAPLLVDLAPELAIFLEGHYQKILHLTEQYSLSTGTRQERTLMAIVRFLDFFATAKRPLMIYLDDLQWATEIDLRILTNLLRLKRSHILVLLTYREDEVPDSVHKYLSELPAADLEIVLDTFELHDTIALLEQIFCRSGDDVVRLAHLTQQRTAGNALFLTKYLTSLYETGILYFDFQSLVWRINFDAAVHLDPPETIVKLLEGQLRDLEPATKSLLELIACLATQTISVKIMALMYPGSFIELSRSLLQLCNLGFLNVAHTVDSAKQVTLHTSKWPQDETVVEMSMQLEFSHDGIKQCCQQLMPSEELLALRSSFALSLLERIENRKEIINDSLFICDLLFDSVDRISTARPVMLPLVFRLFLDAAEKVAQTEVMYRYLSVARKVLQITGDNSIKIDAGLQRRFDSISLDVEIALGHSETALILVQRMIDAEDEIPVRIWLLKNKAQILWLTKRDADIRCVGEQALQLAGFDVNFNDSKEKVYATIMSLMPEIPTSAESVHQFAFKPLSDPLYKATQALLVTILPSIFFVSVEFVSLVLIIGVSTVFRHGYCTAGCYLLSFFGLGISDITSHGFDFPKAKALADNGRKLAADISRGVSTRKDADTIASMGVLQCGVNSWTMSDRQQLKDLFIQAVISTKRAYNSEYLAYTIANAHGFYGCARGQSLKQVNTEFGTQHLSLIMAGDRAAQLFVLPTLQFTQIVLNAKHLQELSSLQGSLIEEQATIEKELYENPYIMHQVAYARCQVLLAIIQENQARAEIWVSKLQAGMDGVKGTIDWAFACILFFYVHLDTSTTPEQQALLELIPEYLYIWSTNCVLEFSAMHKLYVAEEQRKAKNDASMLISYQSAISLALDSGNHLYSALICERAGKAAQTLYGRTVAAGFFGQAADSWAAWGCQCKADSISSRLNSSYSSAQSCTSPLSISVDPALLSPGTQRSDRDPFDRLLDARNGPRKISRSAASDTVLQTLNTASKTISASDQSVDAIDLSSIISTTKLLAQPLEFDALIVALLGHLIRLAGATRGLFLTINSGVIMLSHIATAGTVSKASVLITSETEQQYDIPMGAIRLAVRLKRPVIDRYGQQEAFESNSEKSFVSFPLISRHSEVTGIAYLENNQIKHLFDDSNRIDLLGVLVLQVAASLERGNIIDKLRYNESELISARDEAKAALEIKSRFLATMSHEIRTPFNSVLGFTNLLLDTELDSHQTNMLQLIQSSSQALLIVINDILDFTQIEHGSMKLHESAFSYSALVGSTIESLQLACLEKEIDIVHLDRTKLPMNQRLIGDSTRLRQCLTNLLGNAVKFSERNIIVVESSVTRSDGILNFTMSVQDYGIGVPEAYQKKIFDQFSQVDNSSTRTIGGTGLGLSITKRILSLFGGSISVKSTMGEGSIFTAKFPMKLDSQDLIETNDFVLSKNILIIDNKIQRAEALALVLNSFKSHTTIIDPRCVDTLMNIDAVIISDPLYNLVELTQPQLKSFRGPVLRAMPFVTAARSSTMFTDTSDSLRIDQDLVITTPFKIDQVQRVLEEAFEVPKTAPEISMSEEFADASDQNSVDNSASRLRVLTVDDNAVNIAVAKQFLKRELIATDTASDGVQAVEMADKTPYDLIFMDIQMPRLDGIAATRQIRALYADTLKPGINPVIVALTANAMLDDRASYLEAGMEEFLSKPLDRVALKELLERTRRMVHQRRAVNGSSNDEMNGVIKEIIKSLPELGLE